MKQSLKTVGKVIGWFLLSICAVFCLFAFEMECDNDAEKWLTTVVEIFVKSALYFMIADSISQRYNRKFRGIWWVILAVVGIEVLPLYLDRIVIVTIWGGSFQPSTMEMIHHSFMKGLLSLEYLLRIGLWSLFGVFAYFWGEKTVRYFGKKLKLIDANDVVSITNQFIYFPQGAISDGPVSIIKDEEDHIVILPHSEADAHEAPYWVEQGKIRMDSVLFDLLDFEEYFFHNNNGSYLLTWEELYVKTTN